MALALAGSGSVSQSATGAASMALALAASTQGVVSQAGTGSVAASMALSGTGGVTQAGTGSVSASMALSGTGSVSQSGTGSTSMALALSGTGSVVGNASLVQIGDSGGSLIASGSAATVLPGNSTLLNTVVLHFVSLGTSLSANNISAVTSSMGVFTRLNSVLATSNDAEQEVWYCLAATGTARTVTATLVETGAGTGYLCLAEEWTPGATSAASGGTNSGNSTAPSLAVTAGASGNVVTVQASGYNSFSAGPTSPWTDYKGSTQWSWADANDVAYQVATTSGTVTATWTMNNSSPNYWLSAGAVLTY